MPSFPAAVLVVTLAIATTGVGSAQSQSMRMAADPLGRFTISFPADWRVLKGTRGNVPIVGEGPSQNGFSANVSVQVIALQTPASPKAFAQQATPLREARFHGYTVVKEGDATIAGRPAHFLYMTWKTEQPGVDLYQVLVYFTVGNTGFVLTGATLNDPQRVRHDLPIITQIIATFHPARG